MNLQLTKIPEAEEIRSAIFSLKANSLPGPDGFSGNFFTATWHITGSSIFKAVQHFFSIGNLFKASNVYFLALIPKINSPSSSDYRPIRLLNFSYKIIWKILASRLSHILPSLISTNQAAFVKGRSIHQHIALAHELFQNLHYKTRGGSLCMQLDISKAFDKLSWTFLFKSLAFFGFSDNWIGLVKACVCSAKGLVLINRVPFGFFESSYGLRQGDLLSPYLFILAEEILNLNIHKLISSRLVLPLSTVPKTPCHLFYADEILLFLKGNKNGLLALKDILANYQFSSGQSINFGKSKLFIGKCSLRTKRQILSNTNLQDHPLFSTYLGAPLVIGTPKRQHFNHLVVRFLSKLSGWKSRLLSFTGRRILLRHVLSSWSPAHCNGLSLPQVCFKSLGKSYEEFPLVCCSFEI